MSGVWDWIYSLWAWIKWLIGADKTQAKQIKDLQDRVTALEKVGTAAGPRPTVSIGPFRKQ